MGLNYSFALIYIQIRAMKKIDLRLFNHRNQSCIGIFFPANQLILKKLRSLEGLKWTKTHKCWYVPASSSNIKGIKNLLSSNLIVDYTEELSTRVDHFITNPQPTAGVFHVATLELYQRQLVLKGYSPNTIRTYCNEFRQFLSTIKDHAPENFTSNRLKDYFFYCFNTLKLSENTLHSRMNAVKFYYEQVLYREKFFWEIPRPKKPDQLPKILGENEIGRMFNSVQNLKHKAVLFTAYSAGLRVSEVINLKLSDVDSERMQLFIEKSKGKKDRYVGLSILLLDVLRAYLKNVSPRPSKYVFENPQRLGERYSIRSAQKIFHDAKLRAGINKDVGIHSLRHSFATHLLEKGIDIRYIKDLLGHFSIKTTERYLHVKKETLVSIPNVLDELNKSFTLEW